MGSNLDRYQSKRDFRKTREPEGAAHSSDSGRLFVVQKHAARRLHYDFRLEHEGVLLSWAVPKGPSLDPKERRLAVHVEDHPVAYGDFEGTIPKGQYGGGTVMLWDRGYWEPEGDTAKGLREGRLHFRLYGERLRGGWSLVRTGSKDDSKENWLLIKRADDHARASSEYDVTDDLTDSVATQRSLDSIAAKDDNVWESGRKASSTKWRTAAKSTRPQAHAVKLNPSALPASRKAAPPAVLTPQLATLATEAPAGDTWLHEVKFDGYRLLTHVGNGRVRLLTRNGKDWTSDLRALADAVAALELDSAVLDGEVVALREDGKTDFQILQNTIKSGDTKHLIYYLFDLPYFLGYDLTRCPLLERKQLLEAVLKGAPRHQRLRYSDHIVGQGADVLGEACHHALEGIISKRIDAPYEQRRSKSWLKVKCTTRQEFVIGGYTEPSGSRTHFGALLLGYYEGDALVYCGKVGTGFSDATLKSVRSALARVDAAESPFNRPPPRRDARGAHWVKPALVAEVEFTEWTNEGILRHPSFKGLRLDKAPREVVREVARIGPDLNSTERKGSNARMKTTRRSQGDVPSIAGIALSNPGRVLYPEQGITKFELAQFYEAIAAWILPHIANRPLTIVRCPQGRSSKCFYQKHLNEGLPDALKGVTIAEKEGSGLYVTLSDLAGLIALVQIGALEMHPWGSRNDDVEKPDMITMDLDPGPDVTWDRVVQAAFAVRAVFEYAGLQSFVKTTGGKGLHVVAPIVRRNSWEEVKEFARAVARRVSGSAPGDYVTVMTKSKRTGKIYVDFQRNGRGATAIAAYSTRARAGAPVATPLDWSELDEVPASDAFNVTNLGERLRALSADPWAELVEVRQSITKHAKRSVGMT